MFVLILYIITILIQLCIGIFMIYLVLSFVTGAPFVPSTDPTARAMIDLSHIKPGTKVVDLGSGDGRLLFLAARKGAIALGYEMNPFLVLYSNIRSRLSPYHTSVKTVWKNFWTGNIHDADVVFVYLLPWKMDKLAARLKRDLKPGAIIVSNSFIFPNWKIIRQDAPLHVYVFRR